MEDKNVHWTDVQSLIDWLDYRKTTGHRAARYEAEQEEYWAQLVRDMQAKLQEHERSVRAQIMHARGQMNY